MPFPQDSKLETDFTEAAEMNTSLMFAHNIELCKKTCNYLQKFMVQSRLHIYIRVRVYKLVKKQDTISNLVQPGMLSLHKHVIERGNEVLKTINSTNYYQQITSTNPNMNPGPLT